VTRKEFANRLSHLRMQKEVSARDMSLSLDQSPSYINNIENCINYPSMSAFFEICAYLEISPREFFDTEASHPAMERELYEAVRGLDTDQLRSLITIAKGLSK